MDASHFDRVARLFADRRISRRAAMRQGGVGLAAAGLAAAGLSAAAAQDATPAPSGERGEDDPTFLFVQSFLSGMLVPKEGSSDTFALTLEQGLGHTVYFSDRPERIVGAASTATFLTQFPFGEDNPPNAALVVETSPGETDVVVVELTAPAYDEATHTANYEAKLLADYQELGTTFQEEPKGAEEIPASFGSASLFIDDCPDGMVVCHDPNQDLSLAQTISTGFCYDWLHVCCAPCGGDKDAWKALCNTQFPDYCKGNCDLYGSEYFTCW